MKINRIDSSYNSKYTKNTKQIYLKPNYSSEISFSGLSIFSKIFKSNKVIETLPISTEPINDTFFINKLHKFGMKNSLQVFSPQGCLLAQGKCPTKEIEKNLEGNYLLMNNNKRPLMFGQIVNLLEKRVSKIFNDAGQFCEIVTLPKKITQEMVENASKVYSGDIDEKVFVMTTDNSLAYAEDLFSILGDGLSPETMVKYTKKIGVDYKNVGWT